MTALAALTVIAPLPVRVSVPSASVTVPSSKVTLPAVGSVPPSVTVKAPEASVPAENTAVLPLVQGPGSKPPEVVLQKSSAPQVPVASPPPGLAPGALPLASQYAVVPAGPFCGSQTAVIATRATQRENLESEPIKPPMRDIRGIDP